MQCMASLYNEGRPGMLLEEDMVSAQRSLVSIILDTAEASGYAYLLLLQSMHACFWGCHCLQLIVATLLCTAVPVLN